MLNEQLIRQIDECLEEVEALVPLLQKVTKLPPFHIEAGEEKLGEFKEFVHRAGEYNPKLLTAGDRLCNLDYKT